MQVLRLFLAFIAMLISFLYMHFQVYGIPNRINDFLCVLAGATFDISVILIFFSLITWKRFKLGLYLTSIVTCTLSFSNVIYSRFFHAYLPLDSIFVVNQFGLSFYLNYVKDAFNYYDIIYFILLISLFSLIRNIFSITSKYHFGLTTLFFLIILPNSLMLFFRSHSLWVLHRTNFPYELSLNPKQSIAFNGLVTSNIFLNSYTYIDLSADEISDIKQRFFENPENAIKENNSFFIQKKNVIFILVESYLSCVTDLVVEGKEITPFLNTLKDGDDVYFNGNMVSNVSLGESSDGQFIYLTGLYPLQETYTTSVSKNNKFPAIPSRLKEYGYKTMMTIPTEPNLWQQDRMCGSYGIDSLYCCYDFDPTCTSLCDSTVFLLAEKHQLQENTPFFDMILTLSMHSPYENVTVPAICVTDSYSREYLNYLSLCNYTDRQLHSYFEWAKRTGLYENSFFIIAADHQAHSHFLKVDKELIDDEKIPLFIIDPGSNISKYSKNCISQVDIYTSLMGYLGIEGGWRGVGNNLFRDDGFKEKNDNWNISSQIIRSNFFEKYKD